ncbi:hypothetical protein OHB26_19860 [Nocardia sp. NBC_01503]|uniref:hypothetical protein n=1 Tax=Nocardia sp. NBC_01503 TaxID=2975997 RepID=UPI002E7C2ED6|nr:hypothetical protein [Nocardia sp. NBC_01503]WTL29272.1 hypothetical protein OHB26_19860 [Nocardia sp. NBC_01503]
MTTGPLAESGRLSVLGRESARELVRESTNAAAAARTGILRVTGEPGGDLHFRDGEIVAVDSPGAPGVRQLLSRPGRISTGAADLRLVTRMAALDGVFAITAGWVSECGWQDPPTVPRDPDPRSGIDTLWLLEQTELRLKALAHGRVSPHRNHLVLTETGRALLGSPDDERHNGAHRQEILLWVNGRHSCRDIAILLSRSLYAVTVEVVRMLDADLLGIAPLERVQLPMTEPARGGARTLLPRRRRGASGINDTLPPRPPQPATRALQRAAIVRKSERTQ